jgi:predicted chitinase
MESALGDYLKRFPNQSTADGQVVAMSPHEFTTQASLGAFACQVMFDSQGRIVGEIDYSETRLSSLFSQVGLARKACEANVLVDPAYQKSEATRRLALEAAQAMRDEGYECVRAQQNTFPRYIDLRTVEAPRQRQAGTRTPNHGV